MNRRPFWTPATTQIASNWPHLPSIPTCPNKWHQTNITPISNVERQSPPLHPYGFEAPELTSTRVKTSKRRKKDYQPMKTVKIRLYPTTAQKKVLWQWFKAARDSWNAGTNDIKESPSLNNRQYLQYACKSREGITLRADPKLPLILNAPDTVRDHSISNLKTAFDNGFQAVREHRITHFDMRFKSCREKQSITFDGRHFNKTINMFCPQLWKRALGPNEPLWLKSREPLPCIEHETTITWELGQYHIHVLIPLEPYPPIAQDQIVAVDLGVRTFATAYNGSQYMEYGKHGDEHLNNLGYHMDHLISQHQWVKTHSAMKGPKRRKCLYRMRRAIKKMRLRIRNKVSALHSRCATDLCCNHKVILLGDLQTNRLVLRQRRRIGRRTTRSLLTWAPFRFKQRLLHKARETNSHIIIVNEAYTSRTRTCCGQLGSESSQKILYCGHCHLHMDRDFNGARNILLKWMTQRCPLTPLLATTAPPLPPPLPLLQEETGGQEMNDLD